MARVLVLSPEAPYPVMGGGALRTASLIEYLLARGHTVDLILFGIDGGWDPRVALGANRFGDVLLLKLSAHAKSFPARAARNTLRLMRGAPPLLDRFSGLEAPMEAWLKGRAYDAAVLEHFWVAPYAPLLRRHARRLILDLHNIESVWHQRLASTDRWPLRAGHLAFANAYRRLERQWLPWFDTVLAPSVADAAAAGPRALVYPNSLPPVPVPSKAGPAAKIVFSGNLEYHPNIQGIRWFRRRVWPVLRRRHPELIWRLVGRNEHAIAAEMESGIETSGPVVDAVAELARAQVAVVPILSGSGTRMKILEAWAAGTPVVSTVLGAEGLDANDGEHLLLADSPEQFARRILDLFDDAALCQRIGTAGRELFERRYTWPVAWEVLDRAGNSFV